MRANIIINKPELCEDCNNEFYEITDTNLGVHVNSKITIGGVEVKVRKIMTFKGNWSKIFIMNLYQKLLKKKKIIHIIEELFLILITVIIMIIMRFLEDHILQEKKKRIIVVVSYGEF